MNATDLRQAIENDPQVGPLLERYHLDFKAFGTHAERLSAEFKPRNFNVTTLPIEPPASDSLTPYPAVNPEAREPYRLLGLDAIREGRVACAMLAGGMATRFGGGVKALAEVDAGASFIDLKMAQIDAVAKSAGVKIPVFIMASFASEDALKAWAAEYAGEWTTPLVFPQFLGVRFTPNGDLFRNDDGTLSPYAPGHGDFVEALVASGLLPQWSPNIPGRCFLTLSNVDNLGATLEPELIGAAAASSERIVVEVAPKAPGDAGGIPARLGGKPQVVEGFRIPSDFDADSVRYFNTNSFVFDAEVIKKPVPLDWFVAEKQVDGRGALQFERLVGQLTAHYPTRFIAVSREAERSRFLPCKTPADLAQQREQIKRVLAAAI